MSADNDTPSSRATPPRRRGISRREFLAGLAATGSAGLGIAAFMGREEQSEPPPPMPQEDPVMRAMDTLPDSDDPVENYRRRFMAFTHAIDRALTELQQKQQAFMGNPAALGGIDITFRPAGEAGGQSCCYASLKKGGKPVLLPAMAHAFDAYAALHRLREPLGTGWAKEQGLHEVPSGAGFIDFLAERLHDRFSDVQLKPEERDGLIAWAWNIYSASCAYGDIPSLSCLQKERDRFQNSARLLRRQPSAVYTQDVTVRVSDVIGKEYVPAFMDGSTTVPITVTIENPRAVAAGSALGR